MKNILFSGNTPGKVKDGTKTMTARFWKQRPPVIGEIVTASTGRKTETRFAKLKILRVSRWKPGHTQEWSLFNKTGYTPQEIAEKEGFGDFDEFFEVYTLINGHHDPYDPRRTHYFIEFKVLELLQ